MHKTIRIPDLEHSVRAVLDDMKRDHVSYVVTEGSQPEAVLVPYDEFLKLQKMRENEVLARFDQVWSRMAERNAGISEEEVIEDIEAARAERSE